MACMAVYDDVYEEWAGVSGLFGELHVAIGATGRKMSWLRSGQSPHGTQFMFIMCGCGDLAFLCLYLCLELYSSTRG
jgi:hypothetical protein